MSILCKPSLASYFFTGALALVASVVFSGCKLTDFGNHGADPSTPPPPSDPITGYYGSAPKTVSFCAQPSAASCVAATPDQVPTELAQIMSDPIGFLVQDAKSGQSLLVDSRGSGMTLPIFLDADQKRVSFLGSSSAIPLFSWTPEASGACTRQLYVESEGELTATDAGKPVNSTVNLKGRLVVQMQLTYLIDGDCADELALAKACYLSSDDCGGDDPVTNSQRQQEVQEFFAPYVQAGTLTVDEIANVQAVAYTVGYE